MSMMNWINNYLLDTGYPCNSASVADPWETADCSYGGPALWAIGGGKGGVGKSLIASNFGYLLSKRGYRVLLVDADLGAANLHTFVRAEKQISSLSSFLKGEELDLNRLICSTTFPSLDLISGANDLLDVADVSEETLTNLILKIRKTDYDYVVLDAGPGTSSRMLDLMLLSDSGVLVTTPDPTSIENTYRFLKSLCLRKMKHIINSGGNQSLRESLLKAIGKSEQNRPETLVDIFNRLKKMDDRSGTLLESVLGGLELSILINQARKEKDKGLGSAMSSACADYFGVKVKNLGCIDYEDEIAESIRNRKLLTSDSGHADSVSSMTDCFVQLLGEEIPQRQQRAACT